MINIKIIAVGKIKEQFCRDEIAEYCKRLSRYCNLSVIEAEEYRIKTNASLKEEQQAILEEGRRLLSKIKDDEYVILLDLHGARIDSIEFSKKIDSITMHNSAISFVIGGSFGLSDEVRTRANLKIRLSDLTFTHQMTRVIILEQIYRAFKIINNETYHK